MKKNRKTLSFLSKCMLISSLLWIQSCSDDDENVPENIDSQITFSNITPAMTVWNNVPISLEVSDDMGIASVEVLVDGVSIATLTQAPFTATWDGSNVNDGVHNVKVIVTDGSGNKTEKETTVTLQNTLLTVDIAANQLDSDERGFVFLSDENGNLIASTEYTNSNDVVLKSPAFAGTKFFLTEVLVSDDGGQKQVELWTYPEIDRGQAWKVFDDRDWNQNTDAGKASFTMVNAVANSIYDIYSNAEQTSLDESQTTGSIRLRTTPSKLYVTRRTQQSGGPLGYGFFSNVVVGDNTLNLSQVNQPLSKLTATMPEEISYASVYLKAYPTLGDYTNSYALGTFTNGGVESFDIYYPGTAFAGYYSLIEMDGDGIGYYSGSNTSIFEVIEISNTVSFGFANEKLTYSATGDFAYFVTGFASGDSEWSLILPEGSNKVVPALKVPDQLKAFEIPAFGSPEYYQVNKADGLDDYNDLKTFISTSSYGIDELQEEGKDFTEITYWNLPANGRSKTSNKKHALRTAFRK